MYKRRGRGRNRYYRNNKTRPPHDRLLATAPPVPIPPVLPKIPAKPSYAGITRNQQSDLRTDSQLGKNETDTGTTPDTQSTTTGGDGVVCSERTMYEDYRYRDWYDTYLEDLKELAIIFVEGMERIDGSYEYLYTSQFFKKFSHFIYEKSILK